MAGLMYEIGVDYPEIEVKVGGKLSVYEGFDCTRFEPTTCVNYLYSRQPLREMLVPVKAALNVEPTKKGAYGLSGEFATDRPLASLEILDGVREVLSADRDRVYNREKNVIFRIRLESGRDRAESARDRVFPNWSVSFQI